MVYLVDDDGDDLEIMQAALTENLYQGQVRTATNGKILMDDLRVVDSPYRPNVIILDLNMPLKNGFEVLEEMKADHTLNGIPVIVLTSSQNKKDEVRCLELGCRYYFNKPYKMNEYGPIALVVKDFLAAQHDQA